MSTVFFVLSAVLFAFSFYYSDESEIIKFSDPYETEEGCLSLTGVRKTKRWHSVKVQYQNEQFQTRYKTFTGWTAQIIQHEIDHCEGIII